jgi:hypothetical protein
MPGIDGDMTAYEEFKRLILNRNIKTVVETGTFKGDTTEVLATLSNNVYTVEIDNELYEKACSRFKENKNIKLFNMPTSIFLDQNLSSIKQPIFLFLDAHSFERKWDEYGNTDSINEPLIDELIIIANKKIKPIIAIHDFSVPVYYCNGRNKGYTYESIEKYLINIYGNDGYKYYYNGPGANVGIIYIIPIIGANNDRN